MVNNPTASRWGIRSVYDEEYWDLTDAINEDLFVPREEDHDKWYWLGNKQDGLGHTYDSYRDNPVVEQPNTEQDINKFKEFYADAISKIPQAKVVYAVVPYYM